MRVCMTFYRTVAFPLIAISLICALQVWYAQTGLFVFRVFWAKIITSMLIAIYIALFRNEQFIFYNNLGYSRTSVLLYSFAFDFLIWLVMMIIVSGML
jgi:hypothetical protein